MAWPVKRVDLKPPSLEELAPILSSGLTKNFKESSVTISQCPDLSIAPYNLAGSGLCGNARIADIGGTSNLSPTPQLDKKYSLLDMRELMGLSSRKGLLIGAGAGPFHVIGMNSECMPNLAYEADNITNKTHLAKIAPDGGHVCVKSDSVDFALMANLFGCDSEAGPVLRISAKGRIGTMNFTNTLQKALSEHYGSRTISIGGVFLIKKGNANLHVMPDFSKIPLKTREDTDKWLRYFDMAAPLVCLSVFHSHDVEDLGLRMEHTHCFSDHGGGHYHDDTTPAEVEYEAYFNVAEELYRIDQPEATDDVWK